MGDQKTPNISQCFVGFLGCVKRISDIKCDSPETLNCQFSETYLSSLDEFSSHFYSLIGLPENIIRSNRSGTYCLGSTEMSPF